MAKKTTTAPKKARDLRLMRMKLGRNQAQFWNPLGVTQSGGSRLEGGRNVNKPVAMLLTIAYGTEREAAALVAKLRAPVGEGK